jgi:hypothetical protein
MPWDLKRVFDEYVVIRKKMESNAGARLSHVRRCIRWKRDHNDVYRPMFTHLRHDCGGRPDGGNRSHGVPRVGAADGKKARMDGNEEGELLNSVKDQGHKGCEWRKISN